MRKITYFLLLLLLASCSPQPAPNPHPWAPFLRALDPVDASTPAHDLTAVYLRKQTDTIQIRIDVLYFDNPKDLSIDVQIISEATPQTSPIIIHVPSQTESTRIRLDPQLATVIIDLPLTEIPSRPRVDVSTPEDQILDIKLDSPAITQTAPLLLTFYDTFAARLPAEALRSWDGAHTGPRGERHGLKYLLDAAIEFQAPIALLDLKEPENLSALDAMGLLPQIETLEKKGLLILPEQPEQEPIFDLPPSPFTYREIGSTAPYTFSALTDPSHLYRPVFKKNTFIPIATETDITQPTTNGPSLEVRRKLLENALNADETDLFVLGGSLAESTWGSPDMVGKMLAYFSSRPYIRILNAEDLLSFSSNSDNAILPQSKESKDERTLQIQSTLEFAKNWAKTSLTYPVHHCQAGLPIDLPDCVLANDTYLAIFDLQTASLTYLFSLEQDSSSPNMHQLVGPSWQIAPGIDLYPGAFIDDKTYTHTINGDTLTFISVDHTRSKAFTLTEFGLKVSYQTQEPVSVQIPLLIDPNSRFTSGWAERYIGESFPNEIHWGLEDGMMVVVQTDGEIMMSRFNESLALLSKSEDPDFDYPPGHYVPFPMTIVNVEMQGSSLLWIKPTH